MVTRSFCASAPHSSARACTQANTPGGASPDSFLVILELERRAIMNMRPLHDRIIVKRIEQQRKTASGIVIPDSATEKPEQGEVLAVGDGKRLQDGSVQ